MCTVLLNGEKNGVELYFDIKPAKEILENLKSFGFRYLGIKKCWYAKQSEKTLDIAKKFSNTDTLETKKADPETKKANKNVSLWDLTRYEEKKVDTDLRPKEIAKIVRAELKSRFPFVKFSVTSDYSRLDCEIKNAPFADDSKYLKAIQEYCNQTIKAYVYCTDYDPYGDYGSSSNFYFFGTKISYEYAQTETTEIINASMTEFDIKEIEAFEIQKAQEEEAFKIYLAKREEETKIYDLRMAEEKKQVEFINNNIEVVELEKGQNYFVIESDFAKLNKNCTLEQYQIEVLKGECNKKNVKITREVHFKNAESLEYYSNLLMNDFEFIMGTGGSHTEDKRINSMTDFYNMTNEEQKTVQWMSTGIAVYFDNKLQFVIDSQGHNYARYVGLVDNAKIEKIYVMDAVLENEEVEILESQANTIIDYSKEVDGMQEQFKNADLQENQKVTLFHMNSMGGMIKSKVIVKSFENTTYAQYKDVVKFVFRPENKRKDYYKYFYGELLVFNGWHNLPTTVLNTVEHENNFTITKSKYGSCDTIQYDEIINYFNTQGIKTIINTYKPEF